MSDSRNTHYVFVYGTLKTGQPNHHVLEDSCAGKAKLIGLAKTVDKYPLVIANQFNSPYLLDAKGTGNVVKGELIEVDDKMLETLDNLECHPNYYTREKVQFMLLNDSLSYIDSWVYLLKDFKQHLLHGDMFSEYESDGKHGLRYVPLSLRTREAQDNPQTVWAQNIVGELYEVDQAMLVALDKLEGHPDYYMRVPIQVQICNQVEVCDYENKYWECFVYIMHDFKNHILEKEHFEEYDSHGAHNMPYTRQKMVDADPIEAWTDIKLSAPKQDRK